MSAPNTCTVVVAADGSLCGAPAVTSFVSRGGRVYAECVEHDASPSVALAPAASDHPAYPATRTARPFVLVRDGRIVGYADSKSDAVVRRAAKLGAEIVAVVR